MAQDRSDYYFNLSRHAKSWYKEKLVAIDLFIDSFSTKRNEFELSKDLSKWPGISFDQLS